MKCLIDLDGVVANFVKGCCKLYGKKEEDWPVGQYDFPYKMLGEESEDAVWKRITELREDFWIELEPIHDAFIIVEMCEEAFGKENCAFLSSPPKSSHAAASGKLTWVSNYFPQYRQRALIGACKEFCAHEDAVLVDDYHVQTEKFTAHGGYGILLPRPWNAEYALNAVDDLANCIGHVKAHKGIK